MGSFGDFSKKQKKKVSKEDQARKLNRAPTGIYTPPTPEVINKKRKDNNF